MEPLALALALGRWLLLALMGLFLWQLYRLIARDLVQSESWGGAPGPVGWQLRAVRGEGQTAPGRTFRLDGPLLLGRADDSQIVVSDPLCSGHHARFDADGNGPWVEDLGSTNGTWLDGSRLAPGEPVRLRAGMRIACGSIRFVVEGS